VSQMTTETAAPSPGDLGFGFEAWAAVGPIVGVIAGALLAGVFQLVSAKTQQRGQVVHDLLVFRRTTYLEALDVIERMDRAARQFVNSMSGRTQPDPDDHSDEAEEMRRRDEWAGEAIVELGEAGLDLARVRNRIEAVGAPVVIAAVGASDELVTGYMADLGEQMAEGRFRGKEAGDFGDAFLALKAAVVAAIRSDLAVDKTFRSA
jgi:hypothetical protein